MLMNAAQVKALIEAGLPCIYVEVQSDDGVHFTAIVVSEQFEGLSRVRQHQAVYATLGEMMGEEIHALQLMTFSPDQWTAAKAALPD